MTRFRFKHFLRERVEYSQTGDETLLSVSEYYGVKPRSEAYDGNAAESRADSLEGYRIVMPGDLVMNYMLAWKGAYGLSAHAGITSPAYAVFDVDVSKVDRRFLHHRTRSRDMQIEFKARSKGIIESRLRLYPDALLAMEVDIPDLPTQKRIAKFLDRETARIDELIAKKERLVSLLEERGDAAREELLWGHGPSTKLGHHVSILPGYAFASTNFSENPDDVRLLRGANVGVNEVRWDDVVYWPVADIQGLQRFQLKAGDIVMGMDRPWISGGIRVAEITEDDLPCLLLQRVCKIDPRATLSVRFLKAILESRKFIAYFEPILTGVSVPHISGDQISNFRFPFVDREEQESRMTKLEQITLSIAPITRSTQKSIDRLIEYRSALITAAVTGQIEVETYENADATAEISVQIEEEMRT